MSKRAKVLIALLAAVLLLTVGGAAVAMADEEPRLRQGAGDTEPVLARVAEIFGISQDELADAFEQARQEVREECQGTGNCSMYQEEANRFKQRWTEERKGELEAEQERGRRFQGNSAENQPKNRYRVSEAARGRQMIAVSKGW